MINLGSQNTKTAHEKTEEDELKLVYLKDLEPGDKITGEPFIGKLKSKPNLRGDQWEFYLIIKDFKNGVKWSLGILTSRFKDSEREPEVIYGKKGSRTYILIDSLEEVLNNKPRNTRKYHRNNFELLQNAVNDNILELTAQAVASTDPRATGPNIEILEAKLLE